jgi:hypothetical protein
MVCADSIMRWLGYIAKECIKNFESDQLIKLLSLNQCDATRGAAVVIYDTQSLFAFGS